MLKNTKLAIGIPTTGQVSWQFASSLMALQLLPDTRVIWMVKTMIDTARNNLVQTAMKDLSYTHLLMIDDDMTFEPDFALKLLEHDVDIVGGLAFKRRPDYQPCVYRQNEKDKQYYPILPDVFQEVDVIGTGGILIKMEVLRKMKSPWFFTDYDKDGTHWSVDFRFCQEAKKAEFKIFVDPDSKMGHIGEPELVTIETFYRNVKKINERKVQLENKRKDQLENKKG